MNRFFVYIILIVEKHPDGNGGVSP